MKTLFEQYCEQFSDIQYCGHCMTLKTPNCCDHSYYVEFKDLTPPAQQKIINQELDKYL
jgi:hypothetical protein